MTHYKVTRKIVIPTVSATTSLTRWATDTVDANGNFLSGFWLGPEEIEILPFANSRSSVGPENQTSDLAVAGSSPPEDAII